MPGPLPQVANGRLEIKYTTGSGRTHACNLDVELSGSITGSNIVAVAGGSMLFSDAADDAIAALKAMFNASTTFGVYRLLHYDTGAWIPNASGSSGVAGTNGSADTEAAEGTFTFRDSSYNLDKLVLLEGAFGGLVHQAYAALGVASKAVVDSVLTATAGNIGNFYVSKANLQVASFSYYTQTFNKRLRREAGLG